MAIWQTGGTNNITDLAGITVGQATDTRMKTGVTAVVFDRAVTASVMVLGGAPGTRETDLLDPMNTVDGVDAIVLSGGSAFGLAAAGGVQDVLKERGRGFAVGPHRIPIVPAAILFDLINGGDKEAVDNLTYHRLGRQAAEAASTHFATGNHGAGTGALTAGLKGGLGSASVLDGTDTVAALVAVNPLGSVTIGESRHFWAAPFEIGGEFGGLGWPTPLPADAASLRIKFRDRGRDPSGANTTIGIVATDAALTKAQCKRLAVAAHDGFARAIWPSHTPFDGDCIFGVATGTSANVPSPDRFIDLCAMATATMARAVARGVHDARAVEGDLMPAWHQR